MRRSVPAIAMTLAGIAVLMRFQTTPTGGATVNGTTPSDGTAPSSTPSTAGTTPTTTGGLDPGGGFEPGGDDGPFGRGGEVPTTTPDPNASTATGSTDGSYDGATIETRFGPVQVRITVSGGRLTDVQELQVPNDHQRSVEINDQAGPILRSEALAAQSAALDQVSGATITWAAYEQSLQAALDAAHA